MFLWAEACNTTIYVQNKSPHRALGGMTPQEALVYSHVPKDKREKLEPTTEKGILVGYSETSKTYMI